MTTSNIFFEGLSPASFRGVPFYLNTNSETSGGQKLAIYDYPNSTRRDIFYMGEKPNEYTLQFLIYPESKEVTTTTGKVANQRNSYFALRDQFIEALKKPGKGLLVHPFYGNLECYIESWNISEDTSELGYGSGSLTLKIDVRPLRENFSLTLKGSIESVLVEDLLPTIDTFMTNPITGFSYIQKSLLLLASIVSNISKFKSLDIGALSVFLGFFPTGSSAFNNLLKFLNFVSNATVYYNFITSLFNTVKATNVKNTDTYVNDHIKLMKETQPKYSKYKTAQAIIYNNNIRYIKNMTDAVTLGSIYQAAFNTTFLTIDDINYYKNKADEAFILFESQVTNEVVLELIKKMKKDFTLYLQEQKVNAYKVIDVELAGEPLEVLLYRYYGTLSLYDSILKINKIKDPSWVSGKIKLLAK